MPWSFRHQPKTHYELARQALSQGIHTFVEKPLATSSGECETLIELAEAQDLKLFVGHIFLHSAPVAKLKEMVLNDDFGEIYYMSSTRLNLGPVRHDVSALWDLAPARYLDHVGLDGFGAGIR